MVLGRGPQADIVVTTEELDPKHLLLMPNKNGLWISVSRHTQVPLIIDNEPFHHGTVPWGTRASLGSLILVFGPERDTTPRVKATIHPAIWALAFIVMGILLWQSFLPHRAASYIAAPHAPMLFAVVTKCGAGPTNAEARAFELSANASAKRQRYVFEPHDGVTAVNMFQEAALCFRLAGNGQQAQAVEVQRSKLEREISEDYAAIRLRLDTLLQEDEWRQSRLEISKLKSLLSETKGSYVDWLEQTERYVQMKLLDQGGR